MRGYGLNLRRLVDDQKGMAVVVALLILVVLSILGITLMSLSMTESQIGSNESDLKKAFFAAEAGIQEAMYRMRLDPASFPSSVEGNPACSATADPVVVGSAVPSLSSGISNNWKYNPFAAPTACSWTYSGSDSTDYGNYFGKNPANLDSAGRTFKFCAAGDTSAYCTSSTYAHKNGNQLASANITSSSSDPRSYTVTVAPVVGYVGTCWQYVDQFGTPLPLAGSPVPPPCAVGAVPINPMYKVTSIGTAKNSQKVLSTMIQRFTINPDPKGTLEANTNINVNSASAVIDGKNYDCNGNNPSADNDLKAAASPTGASGISVNKPENLQCYDADGNPVTGVANCGATSGTFPDTIGALLLRGSSATTAEINALNAYLESIKVPAALAPPKTGVPFHGILYVDGNYEMPPDGSTGILIVHHRDASNHDVATLGNFNGGTFKGLIIADKINKINGNATIIGSIFGFGNEADGVTLDDVTGTPNIKYSKCAIDGLSQNFPYKIVSGTWHEQ